MSTEEQNTPPEPAEVPILRLKLIALDKAMRDLVQAMSTDPTAEGWQPDRTPAGFAFTCDFLLNTITKYLDDLRALPIVQRDSAMLERYNDVISRNTMLCTIILDQGDSGVSGALRQMISKEGETRTDFKFSDAIQAKARTLMHENTQMPEFA